MLNSDINFTNNNAVTITLASLADNGIAVSDPIDNTTNKFIYADIQLETRTGSGTNSDGRVSILLIRSADGGTTYDDANNSTEILRAIDASSDTTDIRGSTDTARAGLLPSHWRIGIKNESGAALDATPANHSITFTGKKYNII